MLKQSNLGGPESLRSLIKKRTRARVGGVIKAAKTCFQAERVMKRTKPFKGVRFKVTQFKNNTIFIKVKSSTSAHKIAASADEVIKKINKEIGKDKVKKISFRL